MTDLPPAEAAKLLEQALIDVCDELGCAHDNEAPLIAIHTLKKENAKLREQLRPGSPIERAPTTWAYEQACKALDKHRDRADRLRTALDGIEEALRVGALASGDVATLHAALAPLFAAVKAPA